MTSPYKQVITATEAGLYIATSQLTTFVPHVEKVRKILTSSGFQISYLISITQNGTRVDTITVSHLFVSSWFSLSSHCPDASLSRRARKLIEEFLENEAAKLPIDYEILLNKYGWRNTDFGNVFYRKEIVTNAVEIPIFSGKTAANVIRAENYRLELDNCRAFLFVIEKVADGSSWILYMASYFDILKDLFRKAGYPIQFIFNVYGKSGSGKTSLIKTICSPSQTFSFRSAKRRDTILREAAEYTGHTILIDDYHPAESNTDRNRQAGLKDSLSRSVEETDTFPNIIISSEYLDGHLSMQDREIQIFLDENLDWKLLETLEQHQESLEEIRAAFYVQTVSNAETMIADIKEFCKKADDRRAASNRNYFRNTRYGDYICCVNYLFHKYFVETYHIDFHAQDIKAAITSQLKRQTKHMQIIKNLEYQGTYLVVLRDMLKCKGLFEQIADFNEYTPSADTIHISSKGIVSISPKALRRGMMLYLQTNHVPLKQVIKELQDAEALITYEKGKELTQKHNGKRIYVIDTDALDDSCSFYE